MGTIQCMQFDGEFATSIQWFFVRVYLLTTCSTVHSCYILPWCKSNHLLLYTFWTTMIWTPYSSILQCNSKGNVWVIHCQKFLIDRKRSVQHCTLKLNSWIVRCKIKINNNNNGFGLDLHYILYLRFYPEVHTPVSMQWIMQGHFRNIGAPKERSKTIFRIQSVHVIWSNFCYDRGTKK